jgi:cell division transport system permease protein
MAQIGKSSSKRSQPSYFMAILGVTVVLFFVGVFGWLILNASKYTEVLKENVQVQVYLRNTASAKDVDSLTAWLTAKPYSRDVEYIDKATAKKRLLASGEKDFQDMIEGNPLPASIVFRMKSAYVVKDTLEAIKADILNGRDLVIESVNYPASLVEKMGPILKWILVVLVALATLFGILAIILIDNTIKLSMYSNRFLIKTMQMVGATRRFITGPITKRAVINGALAAFIAIACVWGMVLLSERLLPDLRDLRDNSRLGLLCGLIVVLGIGITLLSTYRSVIKYLKMKLDDLY